MNNKPPVFDASTFVPVPRKPEWPVYQPENLPSAWKKIAEITDVRFKNTIYDWQLYFDGAMLIFHHWSDSINEFNGKPFRHVEQYEFPIGAAAWFVENLPRFFNAGDPTKPQTSKGFHHYDRTGSGVEGKTMEDVWAKGIKDFDKRDIKEYSSTLSDEDSSRFLARHEVRTEIGANAEFTGNGLTANTADGGGRYGVVETLSIEKNTPTLKQLQAPRADGSVIVKTINLKPIE